MMSAEETANSSGAVLRNNGTIQAQDKPLAETTTILPPMSLFAPVTGARLDGSYYVMVMRFAPT